MYTTLAHSSKPTPHDRAVQFYPPLPRRLDTFLQTLRPGATPTAMAGVRHEALGKVAAVATNTFVSTPFTVNYAGRCLPGVPYTHPDSPKLQARCC